MEQEQQSRRRFGARVAGRRAGPSVELNGALGGQTVSQVLRRMIPEAASLGLTERRSFIVNAGGAARQVDASTTMDELERLFAEGEELLVDLNVAAKGGTRSAGGRHG
jgi:hypothetical protein